MQKLCFLILSVFLFSISSKASDSLRFSPTMKVGDKRTAIIEQRTVSVDENGEEEVTKEEPLTSKFEVTKIDDKYIYLDVLYENVVFRQALKTLEKLDMEEPLGENLDLKFRINKITAKYFF